ncbi:MAG: hypothetical protein ACTHJ6_12425, partial [Oryzihumus sp.]
LMRVDGRIDPVVPRASATVLLLRDGGGRRPDDDGAAGTRDEGAGSVADGQRQDPVIDLDNEDALRLLVELATSVFREALSHALRR